mgnify:FL=1
MSSHPVPEQYAEKHTLVLIPTLKKENEDGELLDYDFSSLSDGDNDSIALALNTNSQNQLVDITIGENSGTLIPPSPLVGTSY